MYTRFNRHILYLCVILATLLFAVLLYTIMTMPRQYVIFLKNTGHNISCHYEDDGDALPSAEEQGFVPPEDSIFFLETSCKGGLNSRQACGIESAARAHPDRQTYVLFSGPVNNHTLQHSILAKLKTLGNINYARIHAEEYARGTPLETLIANRTIIQGYYPVVHTADVLRLLTLYKWSGIYLDMDILVVKSLNPLGLNWIGSEDNTVASTAAMALSNDELAFAVSDDFVRELARTFDPHKWNWNGPGTVSRVLARRCDTSSVSLWSAYRCGGFQVYDSKYIYPIHYSDYDLYFNPDTVEKFKNKSQYAFTHHLWNRLNYDEEFVIPKNSPYDMLAKELCPTVYETYGHLFGL